MDYNEPKQVAFDIIPVEERIQTACQDEYGLYPHESVLLHYAPKYMRSTERFHAFWWYDYGMKDVGNVLESLVDRGFLGCTEPDGSYFLTPEGKKAYNQELVDLHLSRGIRNIDIWTATKLVHDTPGVTMKELVCNVIYDNFHKDIANHVNAGASTPCGYLTRVGEYQMALEVFAYTIYYCVNEGVRQYQTGNLEEVLNVVFWHHVADAFWRGIYVADATALRKLKKKAKLKDTELGEALLRYMEGIEVPFEVFTKQECVAIAISEMNRTRSHTNQIYDAVEQRLLEQYPSEKFFPSSTMLLQKPNPSAEKEAEETVEMRLDEARENILEQLMESAEKEIKSINIEEKKRQLLEAFEEYNIEGRLDSEIKRLRSVDTEALIRQTLADTRENVSKQLLEETDDNFKRITLRERREILVDDVKLDIKITLNGPNYDLFCRLKDQKNKLDAKAKYDEIKDLSAYIAFWEKRWEQETIYDKCCWYSIMLNLYMQTQRYDDAIRWLEELKGMFRTCEFRADLLIEEINQRKASKD